MSDFPRVRPGAGGIVINIKTASGSFEMINIRDIHTSMGLAMVGDN